MLLVLLLFSSGDECNYTTRLLSTARGLPGGSGGGGGGGGFSGISLGGLWERSARVSGSRRDTR